MLEIRKLIETDNSFVLAVLKNFWGSDTIIVKNISYHANMLQGYIATDGRPIGLITYVIEKTYLLIISLNSLTPGKGIGTQLVNKVVEEARNLKLTKIVVVTTNDNIKAQEFYKKRGFLQTARYNDSIKKARLLKPEIPEIGENGILITDEIEFTLTL